jgi:hypothetical protein
MQFELMTADGRLFGFPSPAELQHDLAKIEQLRFHLFQDLLGLKQAGEVAKARRRIGMLGAEHLLTDRQRALEKRPRPRKVALGRLLERADSAKSCAARPTAPDQIAESVVVVPKRCQRLRSLIPDPFS